MGAKDEHTLKSFLEAEAYNGPSLIIAYSHCIAHGINMTTAMSNQKVAVDSGQWLLYRYNPERAAQGENPLILDSRTPTRKVQDFMSMETRFKMLTKSRPEDAKQLWAEANMTPPPASAYTNIWRSVKETKTRQGAKGAIGSNHDRSQN